MKTSSYILIPATVFGNATGNYDGVSLSFSSVPQKAAAYYSKDKGIQTVSWHLTNFIGTITLEATLDSDSATTNYFPIHTVIGNGIAPVTASSYANIQGNYTWIRATVANFTGGSINKITVGY